MFSEVTAAAPQNDLLLEGQRALLRAVQNQTFEAGLCAPEVLSWLEQNELIEALLDDDNEFEFHLTEQGREAVAQLRYAS